ncbi:MAG: alpha/beta hydrolase family protein [Woeseiaceae bacterium]
MSASSDIAGAARGYAKARKALRFFLRCLVVALGLLALYYIELVTVQRDFFDERNGELIDAKKEQAEFVGTRSLQNVTLTSTSGLVAELRVLRPAVAAASARPVVLMIGGQQTGKHAVDLVSDPGNLVFAAIDYPYHGPTKTKGFWQTASAIPHVQRGALDTPPALQLALDWLVKQPWIDPGRIELIGVSVGVPFAAAAGAIDRRVSRVWLVHGAADNLLWTDFALTKHIENDSARRVVAKLALLLSYGASFETQDWMAEIVPRPIIVISSRNDDRVPAGGALADAASNHATEIIWTEGRHVQPSRQDVLAELLEIVHERTDVR